MKRILSILALLLSAAVVSSAQDDFRKRYEEFSRQAMATYSDFRRECNEKYAEFMQFAWEYYKAGPAVQRPQEKEVPPVILKDDERPEIKDREIKIAGVVPIPEPTPRPRPVAPIHEQPAPPIDDQPVTPIEDQPVAPVEEPSVHFNFFGTPMSIRAGEAQRFKLKSTHRNDVSSVWRKLSGREYDNMLFDCLKVRDEYHLCDWAYLLMLFSFTDEFLGSDNESMLLTSYIFSQSGYKMRMGLSKKGIALLFGTKHQIYGAPCYEIDGEYYYQLNGQDEEMEIVNFSFPNEKPLSLAINSEQAFGVESSDLRALASKGYGKVASCSVNKNLIEFYSLYPSSQLDDNPLTRWALYANTPLEAAVKQQLYPSLTRAIEGKSKAEAADVLLDFVQTAFTYEYDDKVWGGDRAFFSEETLFYPYCDCEDRSIFYSRLVRDLLGLDVVLVYYPGHLATAVKFPDYVEGDYISISSGRYLVCDPTYIGASIGMTMPDMNNDEARVILLN